MTPAFIVMNKLPEHDGWTVVNWLQPLPHNWSMWARRCRGMVRDLRKQGIPARLVLRGSAGDRDVF